MNWVREAAAAVSSARGQRRGWFAEQPEPVDALLVRGVLAEHAPRWQDAHTFAAGIRVPQAVGDFLILRAVRDSGGFAIAVDDAAIAKAWREVAAEEGFLLCPEGAATYAAYKAALADGRVGAGERAVLFNCATGLKYPMPEAGIPMKLGEPVDWGMMGAK